MELIAADLDAIRKAFTLLGTFGAELVDLEDIRVTFKRVGSDQITVGYGDSAEVAVVGIVSAEDLAGEDQQ